jgi:hypothetical protein
MAVEALVLALLAVLVVGLLRSHAEILRTLHELGAGLDESGTGPAGSTGPAVGVTTAVAPPSPRLAGQGAPDITGVTPHDEAVALAPSGQDTLLAFLTTGCTSCMAFWEALRDTAVTPAGARVVVVTRGPGDESVGSARSLAGPRTTVVMSSQAWSDYGVPGAPYFVQVSGTTGRVSGEGTAKTWDQVLQLAGRAASDADAGAADPGAADPGPAGPWSTDAEREARIDRELEAAGIRPGDPRLFHHDDQS